MKTIVIDTGCPDLLNVILPSQNHEVIMFETALKIIFLIKFNVSLISYFFCSRIIFIIKEFKYIFDIVVSNRTVKSLDSEVEKAYTQGW
jgi:hypothetical protein